MLINIRISSGRNGFIFIHDLNVVYCIVQIVCITCVTPLSWFNHVCCSVSERFGPGASYFYVILYEMSWRTWAQLTDKLFSQSTLYSAHSLLVSWPFTRKKLKNHFFREYIVRHDLSLNSYKRITKTRIFLNKLTSNPVLVYMCCKGKILECSFLLLLNCVYEHIEYICFVCQGYFVKEMVIYWQYL